MNYTRDQRVWFATWHEIENNLAVADVEWSQGTILNALETSDYVWIIPDGKTVHVVRHRNFIRTEDEHAQAVLMV